VTTDGAQKLSLSGASAERIVVKYPSDGGYEPGDTWDLYVGADKRIVEIAYHHGANKPPKLVIATWGGPQEGWPTPCRNGSPWDLRWKAAAGFHFGCVGKSDGIRKTGSTRNERRKGSFERLIVCHKSVGVFPDPVARQSGYTPFRSF